MRMSFPTRRMTARDPAVNGANVALRTHCGSSRGYTCTLAARVPIKLRRNTSRLTFLRSDATGSFRRRTGPTGGGSQRGRGDRQDGRGSKAVTANSPAEPTRRDFLYIATATAGAVTDR